MATIPACLPSNPFLARYITFLLAIVVGLLPPMVSATRDWWIIFGTAFASAILRVALVVFSEMGFEGFWKHHTSKEEQTLSGQFLETHRRLDALRDTLAVYPSLL